VTPRRRARVPLAITMGDPAGIGPEVALRAITQPAVAARVEPILVGDLGVWRDTARRLRLRLRFVEAARTAGQVTTVVTSALPARLRQPGPARSRSARAACGAAAYAAILEAVRLVQGQRATAVVTAPISKAHLAAAGHDVPGHTELLAQLCGGVPVRMMMVGRRLRVVLVTTHVALAAVPRRLSTGLIGDTIRIAAAGLREHFGIARPRLAVAGLNPHAGEHGLFGDEEARVIVPPCAGRASRPSVRWPPTGSFRSYCTTATTPSSACITIRDWRPSSCCTLRTG
jgi:4-hydroxy-L-threonine phosphate dehydrogenase PdxA